MIKGSLIFLLAVFVQSYLELSMFVGYVFTLLAVVIGIGAYLYTNTKLQWAAIALIITTLAIFRFNLVPQPTHTAESVVGQTVTFTGIIDAEPDRRISHQKLTIQTKEYGLILLNTGLYPRYHYAQTLKIKCKLTKPQPIEDFAYDEYLALKGIYTLCSFPHIEILPESNINNPYIRIKRFMLTLKDAFTHQINTILPEPHASLLAGLLIGTRSQLPPELKLDFQKTGTAHIVAVSGYNISLIVNLMLLIAPFLWISRKIAVWFIIIGIILFVMLTGAESSVVRAAIMGIITITALRLGRPSVAQRALLFTAVLMVLYNPLILRFDVGFQLSFAATLGLIYISPWLGKMFKRIKPPETLTTTLAAMIATLPIILWNFGTFSWITPIANLLILWAIPYSMLLGFLAGITGFFLPFSMNIFAWGTWVILSYVLWVIQFLSF